MSIFNENDRKVKKLKKLASKIEALEEEYKAKSSEELADMTRQFRERLNAGETLDDLLVEAYATVREASARVLHMRPFPVQIMGAIALHQGRIAEMATGEGKTLVATMPAYLNALTSNGVHVVTVDGQTVSFPRADGRSHRSRDDRGSKERILQCGHHLLHQQRTWL